MAQNSACMGKETRLGGQKIFPQILSYGTFMNCEFKIPGNRLDSLNMRGVVDPENKHFKVQCLFRFSGEQGFIKANVHGE